MVHKARTSSLCCWWLFAACLTLVHDVFHPCLSVSFSTVQHQVVLGLRLFLFPSGFVHPRAIAQSLFTSFLRSCPIKHHLFFLTSWLIESALANPQYVQFVSLNLSCHLRCCPSPEQAPYIPPSHHMSVFEHDSGFGLTLRFLSGFGP